MKSKDLRGSGEPVWLLVFETGDEAVAVLTQFAREHNITAAHFTAIGAFERVVLGYFDIDRKQYLRNEVNQQVEVVSLIGDIALQDEHPTIHAHVVVARRDGMAMGGHLIEGDVRPTLELTLNESPAHLQRKMDERSGLALINL